jgi:hypothetical protein
MYNTNAEYRETLRQFFKMDMEKIGKQVRNKYTNFDTFDRETRDELMFDSDAVDEGMRDILEKTRDIPVFRQLYVAAAGLMLSERIDIGLAVLLSYDYFADFSSVLASYIHSPDMVTVCESWIKLSKKLIVSK